MRQTTALLAVSCGLVSILSGCSAGNLDFGDGTDTGETTPNDGASPYDRSESEGTCDGWKFAYCDAIAACSAFESREQCELDLVHMDCLPDAPIESCAAEIDAAVESEKCDELPFECSPVNIADRSEANARCEEIHEAQCEFRLFCGLDFNLEACLSDAALKEPCGDFLAAKPEASECANDIAKTACDSPAPASCINVLIR